MGPVQHGVQEEDLVVCMAIYRCCSPVISLGNRGMSNVGIAVIVDGHWLLSI